MDEYGYMEDVIDEIKTGLCTHYGAERVLLSDLHPELAGVKYTELYYNPKTANPWAHVRAGESLAIWIIPKKN